MLAPRSLFCVSKILTYVLSIVTNYSTLSFLMRLWEGLFFFSPFKNFILKYNENHDNDSPFN